MAKNSRENSKKFNISAVTPLFLIIALEVLGVIFMMAGILPREAALFFAGIFIFFVFFAPLRQAVLFSVFSIPLYIALPISESFDMMASWRIIIAVLFLRVLMKGGWGIVFWRICRLFWHGPRAEVGGKTAEASEAAAGRTRMSQKIMSYPPSMRLGILISIFFALGILSLFVAPEPIFGIKKLIYFANIFALFFVIRMAVRSKSDFLGLLKYTFAGSLVALIVGYAQFLTVLFVPLYTFWQWWAHSVIPIFYGASLGNLLSYSNTWFSYYDDAEATLRMFSVFPDSHSLALFMLLSLPMAFTFLVVKKSKSARIFLGTAIVFILLAIILSGTRGVWVGVLPVFAGLLIVFILWRGLEKKGFGILGCGRGYIRKLYNEGGIQKLFFSSPNVYSIVRLGVLSFVIFALLFPVSSQLLKFSQMRQGGDVSDTTFERVSTSFSTREISNMGRIQIWESTFESIAKHPFLGVGIGNYPVVLDENVSSTKEGASAHSLYLDVISEMGILAGIILLLIFFEILWRAIKTFINSKDFALQAFAGFFAIYFLWVMVYSAVDVVLLNDKVLLLFTVLVSLLYAGFNQHSRLQRRGEY